MTINERWLYFYLLIVSQEKEEMIYAYEKLTVKGKQGTPEVIQRVIRRESPDFRKRKKK